MEVSVTEEDNSVFTVLNGLLPDQAALMGVLQHLYNCGITVISVENISTRTSGEELTKNVG